MKNIRTVCFVLLLASCHNPLVKQDNRLPAAEIANVCSCFNDCVRLLQGTAHHSTLDKLLFRPDPQLLAECLRLSSEIAKQNKTAKLQGDFSKLRWNTDTTRLITLDGKAILFESAPQICGDWLCYKLYVEGQTNATAYPEVFFPMDKTD